MDLKDEVFELIKKKFEGEYWDFKLEWHSRNLDLLHDIICMANSPANRDCYIIIGVEDSTGTILGVSKENRKNQQNIIDLIRQKPVWAGGFIPEVHVRKIEFDEKEIDVILIRQSNNTPYYLLEDYSTQEKTIHKGVIYTRKGDTNTPKNKTADVYDVEILWKRRFGLLHNPSQRAKIYVKDIDNWELVETEGDKSVIDNEFYFYQFDPDYTIRFIEEGMDNGKCVENTAENINDKRVGANYFYLFSFFNVSYHGDFSNNEKVVLYYKNVPLFSSYLEVIDEGRTTIVPPEHLIDSYYIMDSFRYLMYEFIFARRGLNYSNEAKLMLHRVIPMYLNDLEQREFVEYIVDRGFSKYEKIFGSMKGEALERLNVTKIEIVNIEEIQPYDRENIAKTIVKNPECVYIFAEKANENIDGIINKMQVGKMLVDWLTEWRSGSYL